MTDPAHWAFGTEQGVKCPDCGQPVAGVDWFAEHPTEGMILRPCQHRLTTPPWKLIPAGISGHLRLERT